MTAAAEIIVAGTGPAGLMAALALAASGREVALVGPGVNLSDRRTTALMKPSLDFLARIGIADAVDAEGAALKVMRIVDGTARLVRSPTVTFRAAEIGEALFGVNIPNSRLLAILSDAIERTPAIRRVVTTVRSWSLGDEAAVAELDDGGRIGAGLVVAADGRRSPAREAAGIATTTRATGQSALVLNFAHQRDHGGVSTEFHTEAGPFTQVPLPGLRSSLVWVARPATLDATTALDDARLSRTVEDRMQSMLGRVEVEPGRQVYPLSMAMPRGFAARRVVLVGEAAHVFPPIGAQGLNLGIRDIEGLLAALDGAPDGDPGSPAVLSAYERRRRPDITARTVAVDLLNRSLLSDMLPAQLARAAGLALLDAAPPLRSLFMREGLRTGSGFLNLAPGSPFPAPWRRQNQGKRSGGRMPLRIR